MSLAHQSGVSEVYVRPVPDVQDRLIEIPDGGGLEPARERSGKELFYRDARGGLVSVSPLRRSFGRTPGPA